MAHIQFQLIRFIHYFINCHSCFDVAGQVNQLGFKSFNHMYFLLLFMLIPLIICYILFELAGWSIYMCNVRLRKVVHW